MEKNSIKLMGGLANMLFQISTAYAYSKKHSKELFLTESGFHTIHKHISEYKDNIFSKLNFSNTNYPQPHTTLEEKGFHYNELPYISGNVLLSGYFQSELYFKEYTDDIRNLFDIDSITFDFLVSNFATKHCKIDLVVDDTCSIHVRRGDFLNLPNHHPQQGMDYYMKAAKKIGLDKKFLIFSDDINWCKENFPDMDNFIFVEGLKDYEDLYLMSLCKHNIICNSSFSWWAAWLNNNPNKQVIMPKNWFGSAYSNFDTKDLCCKDWQII